MSAGRVGRERVREWEEMRGRRDGRSMVKC
jgi:hypothetical protein